MSGLASWHYKRREACEEIAEFLRGRWAAVYIGPVWMRWRERDKPLTVESCSDVLELVERHGARSFYGTLEKFNRLESRLDVMDDYPVNIASATMYIDIDVTNEYKVEEALPYVKRVLETLVEWFHDKGVQESLYILWSGAGAHLRVHEEAIGPVGDLDPVEEAYLLAEYSLRANKPKLQKIVEESGGLVKIENMIARNRVFTAPMSLHRRLERVAVTFRPEALGDFNLSWTTPGREKHDPEAWRHYKRGEATSLVEEALRILGRSPERTIIPAPRRAPARIVGTKGRIGRFPVMALLQAARYYVLNGDLDKAKSFGLNRAIFYAWAKYYGPARSAARRLRPPGSIPGKATRSGVKLRPVPGMEEQAPMSEDGWFVMGNVEQRPEDFDRNVASKFEAAGIPFEEAWRAAVEYVSRFPRSVLRDPQKFYKLVYEPVRDSFVEKVLEARPEKLFYTRRPSPSSTDRGRESRVVEARRPRSLLDWIEKNDESQSDNRNS